MPWGITAMCWNSVAESYLLDDFSQVPLQEAQTEYKIRNKPQV